LSKQLKTSIGGQALIEGVMMRGPKKTAMAVRTPSGEIATDKWDTGLSNKWYKRTPFIRGIFNFIDMMVLGYRCLMKSAEMAGVEEEPDKFDLFLEKHLGDKASSVIGGVVMVLGFALALLLFMFLPAYLVSLLGGFIHSKILLTLVEGIVKITVFIAYLWAVSRMPEIGRTFEYHGAEHKTIFCYEAGLPLTVDNVKKQIRFHPRCGTSFIIIVLIISIVLFSVLTWDSILMRVAMKLLLLPLVVGIGYEIIKIAGRYDNIATRIISWPGLCLQRLTTREPDDSQIEVAIASMVPVIPENPEDAKW
jgi:uncharacterized protein YqhQ